jgi:hypothetical protein
MKILISALILDLALFMSSAQAAPREGSFDDMRETVPKSSSVTFQYEIAPPSADMRRRLQERAP